MIKYKPESKEVPIPEVEKHVGKTVVIAGKPRFVKNFMDGKFGYVITDRGSKIMCSSPVSLDSTPVKLKGKIKKVYGIVYLDVEKKLGTLKEVELKPPPPKKKGLLDRLIKRKEVRKPLPEIVKKVREKKLPKPKEVKPTITKPKIETKIPFLTPKESRVPIQKVKFKISKEEIEKIIKKKEKVGLFTRLKRWIVGRKKTKPPVPKPFIKPKPKQPTKIMLPEERKELLKKHTIMPKPKGRGLFERLGFKKKEPAIMVTKPLVKPKGKGLFERLRFKRKEKPPVEMPKKVPVTKIIPTKPISVTVKKPEELAPKKVKPTEKKLGLFALIKKGVKKKKAPQGEVVYGKGPKHVVEKVKVQEIKYPTVVEEALKPKEKKVVEKKEIYIKGPKGKIIKLERRELPTKVIGPSQPRRKLREDVGKGLEEPTRVVAEIKQVARTPIDYMLRRIRESGSIPIEVLSSEMGVPINVIETWADILEDHKLIKVDYPAFGNPVLKIATKEEDVNAEKKGT